MNKYLYSLLVFILLLCSCEEAPKLPKVDHIEVDANIVRFDKALLSLDSTNLSQSFTKLKLQYPALTDLLFERIIPLKKGDSIDYTQLKDFVSNKYVQHTLDTIQYVLPSLHEEEKQLEQAFRYFRHYFPEAVLPKVYAGYTDFSFQTFIFDDFKSDGICASTDLFLGEDYPYKSIDPKNPAFSEYITKRYDRKYMVKKIMELMVEEEVGALQGKRTIDHMIYQGKKWYILQKLLPQTAMPILAEYTNEEWEWCEASEKAIWSYFLDQNLLYETNQAKIKTYVFESPRSQGMPEESPGRTAHYLGWKIIEKYMEETNLTIPELVKEKDSQKILKLSKYKPKRK